MITTLLWDIDGTLLDFSAAEKSAIRRLFCEFNLGECTDDMLRRYSQINAEYWQKLERKELTKPEILIGRFSDFFKSEGINTDVAAEFNRRYQVCLGDTVIFRDDSYNIVKSLRGRVKQYAVSNGTVIAQTKKLLNSGFDKLMDGVFLSEQVGYEKPDIRFFENVFEHIPDTEKSQIMIIGDSLTSDIKGGNNAKILTCWYNPAHKQAPNEYKINYDIDDLHKISDLI